MVYYRNLSQGRHRLCQLQQEATRPLFDVRTLETHGPRSEELRLCVNLLHTEISTMTANFPLLCANTSYPEGISTLSPYLIDGIDEVDLFPGRCPLCESPDGLVTTAARQGNIEDIGSAFEACRNQLVWHFRDLYSRNHLMNVERVIARLRDYEHLAEQLIVEVGKVLKKLVGRRLAKLSQALGLYHDDRIVRLEESIMTEDCLKRTALHRYLDQLYHPTVADLAQLQYLIPQDLEGTRRVVNQLDILDRSPLYIACQKRWKPGVLALLLAGADPAICTVYRTTPLHYAAADGHTEICKALLDFTPVYTQTVDCSGKTALDHACGGGHTEVAAMILQVSSGLREGVMYI